LSDVRVRLEGNVAHVEFLGMRTTVAHCVDRFDLRVRRAVEKAYSFVKGCGRDVPDVAICDVADAVVDAVRAHPDFPAWDVHNA